MESPSKTLSLSLPPPPPPPHSLSTTTTTSLRHRSSNSPEFEFSKIESNSQTLLHSADELFSDGFLLPLHRLHPHHRFTEPDFGPLEPDSGPLEPDSGPHEPDLGPAEPCSGQSEPGSGLIGPAPEHDPEPSASITSTSNNPILSASKRWREIFKRGEKKNNHTSGQKTDTDSSMTTNTTTLRSSNKNNCNSGNRNSSAELNIINIWPFSRSRSAGNGSSRAKPAVQINRKVSSAPCSRSNSSGESKSRKSWPNSPGRTGVHLGRSSPVWQVRKPGSVNRTAHGPGSGKGRVLKLNVPVCIGYRQSVSCRSDEGGADSGAGSGGGGSGSNGNMFGLRGLFSKKSTVLTV